MATSSSSKAFVLRTLSLERLILLALGAYLTVHLLEEGFFGFPAWAEQRWGIPIALFITVDMALGI